jgi:hypothetical protein
MKKGIMKIAILLGVAFLFAGCSDLPCTKSYQLHLKANMATTQAEKEYYEKQAIIYDQQCANYNAKEYQDRQREEFIKRKP